MCGIAGVISTGQRRIDSSTAVGHALLRIAHRGPTIMGCSFQTMAVARSRTRAFLSSTCHRRDTSRC